MSDAVICCLAAAGELLLCFLTGGLLPLSAPGEKKSLAETICSGFLLVQAAAGTVGLIAVRAGWTLTACCYVLSAVLTVMISLSVLLNFSSIYRGTSSISGGFHRRVSVITAVVFGIGYIVLVLITPSPGDPGQVIAQMASDLYWNSAGHMVPGSGAYLAEVPARAATARYFALDELVCTLTGLHPMIQMRLVRTGLLGLLACLVMYRIFYRVFAGEYRKAAAAFILAVIVCISFQTPFTPQGILVFSGWTGYASLAVFYIPVSILMAQSLYDRSDNVRLYILYVVAGLGSVSLSGSAIVLWPVCASVFLAGAALVSKKFKILFAIPCASLMPALVFLSYLNTISAPR